MSAVWFLLHLVVLLALPIPFVGIIQRTKALWAGRRGPPLLQTGFDLARLMRKQPVYSDTTTVLFRTAPLVLLATTWISGLFVPLLGGGAPLSFPLDFVALAYLWGLGRLFVMLAALDTGSSFEGMGASREATYAAFVEPAYFLTLGALMLATGHRSFAGLLQVDGTTPGGLALIALCAGALFVVLQVESARMPVDDPGTHLELTMVHEVMVLDHSGPDLAAIQYASASKMVISASLIASLLHPGARDAPLAAGVHLALIGLIAVVVGCVEALVARLKLRAVPQYILASVVAASTALLIAAWSRGAV